MKRRNSVDGAELPSGGDDVVALLAVALDLDPTVVVAVLDHHHQSGPTLRQVVSGHALSAFVTFAWRLTILLTVIFWKEFTFKVKLIQIFNYPAYR